MNVTLLVDGDVTDVVDNDVYPDVSVLVIVIGLTYGSLPMMTLLAASRVTMFTTVEAVLPVLNEFVTAVSAIFATTPPNDTLTTLAIVGLIICVVDACERTALFVSSKLIANVSEPIGASTVNEQTDVQVPVVAVPPLT